MRTSARATSSKTAFFESSFFRSSATERLPRSMTSCLRSRLRPRSAACGRSTISTSAPMSASTMPAKGAGPIASISSTLMPLSGPGIELVYSLTRMPARFPERIVCLTEETTETLYLLGEERRIVGISGYTVRPPRARREKPRVSAFLSAQNEKIFQLKPDLVLGFSDLQADIARDLAKAGLNVVLFNQRSVDEILSMVLVLSSMVGAAERGAQLVSQLEANLAEVRGAAARLAKRPKVYFEEWDQPMISAIR